MNVKQNMAIKIVNEAILVFNADNNSCIARIDA